VGYEKTAWVNYAIAPCGCKIYDGKGHEYHILLKVVNERIVE